MTSVAIMQPTYLPWMGYLALLNRVDIFVFLDSVQFAKRSWQQRNQIKGPTGPQFITVPVLSRGRREQHIENVEIDCSREHWHTHRRAIEYNYANAPYFHEYSGELLEVIGAPHTKLGNLNISLIDKMCTLLGIKKKEMIRSSALSMAGHKADLLANICSHLKADLYISPVGSKSYMEQSTVFSDRGIEVLYNEYRHPVYRQLHGAFVPYMSTIDLLFNVGPGSLDVINQGVVTT